MKLHLEYTFAEKEIEEDFDVPAEVAKGITVGMKKEADSAAAWAAVAVEVIDFFYSSPICTGLNTAAVRAMLHPNPDDTSENRRSYCRLFASLVRVSPNSLVVAKLGQQLAAAIEAKDANEADNVRLLIKARKEMARVDARDAVRKIIKRYADERHDPDAPDEEKVSPSARERIEGVKADWEAILASPRGTMKLVAEQALLKSAIAALGEVLKGKQVQPLELAAPRTIGAESRAAGPVVHVAPEEYANATE